MIHRNSGGLLCLGNLLEAAQVVVKSLDAGARLLRLKPWLCHY